VIIRIAEDALRLEKNACSEGSGKISENFITPRHDAALTRETPNLNVTDWEAASKI
tara:strand:- start:9932 stop:10099 length:168 start_codon:yes stop_codon:yes gene_type:complete